MREGFDEAGPIQPAGEPGPDSEFCSQSLQTVTVIAIAHQNQLEIGPLLHLLHSMNQALNSFIVQQPAGIKDISSLLLDARIEGDINSIGHDPGLMNVVFKNGRGFSIASCGGYDDLRPIKDWPDDPPVYPLHRRSNGAGEVVSIQVPWDHHIVMIGDNMGR